MRQEKEQGARSVGGRHEPAVNHLTVKNTNNEQHLSNTSSITEAGSAHNTCEPQAEGNVTHLRMTPDSDCKEN